MIRTYCNLVASLSRMAGWVAAIMLLLAVFIVCQMVFVRYVLQGSVIWQTEFVTYLLIAATFIGSPYVLLLKGHVYVDLLYQYLTPRLRFIFSLSATLLALFFCLLITWSSYHEWFLAWQKNWKSDSMWAVRLWIPYASLPIGFFILSLQFISNLLLLVSQRIFPLRSAMGGE